MLHELARLLIRPMIDRGLHDALVMWLSTSRRTHCADLLRSCALVRNRITSGELIMRVLATLVSATIFASAAAPAFADGVLHSANSEMGYTTHPEHAVPGKSRAEVLAEVENAKTNGTWQYLRVGAPLPIKAGTALTRAQVEADLLRAQRHPSWNARRTGAPVAMD